MELDVIAEGGVFECDSRLGCPAGRSGGRLEHKHRAHISDHNIQSFVEVALSAV